MARYRNVMFTGWLEHNPDPPEYNEEYMNYMVFQKEKCPSTGRLHWQGYAELKVQLRLKTLKELFGNQYNFQNRYGNQQQAIDYCTKKATRVEEPIIHGRPKAQGKRSDIIELKERCKTESFSKLAWECPNYNVMKMCETLCGLQSLSHEYKKKTVYWFYGDTGTGKTRYAKEHTPAENTWTCNTSSQWFDGYHGQEYVILDDIRAKHWSYDLLLRLLDGYELRLPFKGGFTVWRPHTIYITAPFHPSVMYSGTLQYHGSINQLLRRITKIKQFGEKELHPLFLNTAINNHTTVNETVIRTIINPSQEMEVFDDSPPDPPTFNTDINSPLELDQ